MSATTITKIVFLALMTMFAIIALFAGFVISGKKRQNKKDVMVARQIMKIRLICFVVMLVCLLICIII